METKSQKHHLLILSQHGEIYKQLIDQEALPGLSCTAVKDPKDIKPSDDEYDIVFGEPSRVCKVLNNFTGIRWVQSTWAGVEPLLTPLMRQDYLLTNARNVYGQAMAEYVFGYLLMIERQVLPRWQSQLAGRWDNRLSGTLRNKVLGLMGVGSIGSHLAEIAHKFDMQVYGYTRQSEGCQAVDRYFHGDSLYEFASTLDYLVCSLPGTSATNNIVDENFLSALPVKTWLVNIGRGSTVNEVALVKALESHRLAGAVLDVYSEEPLPQEHPLWSTPNTFITFHTAAQNYPPDIARIFINNYKRFLEGQPLLFQVDFNLGY
jgi:phosphoglycerate dehydrogenase-like enzyme